MELIPKIMEDYNTDKFNYEKAKRKLKTFVAFMAILPVIAS